MEINTQQMEALLQVREQQAQLPHRNNGQTQGFEALLAQQLNNGLPETQLLPALDQTDISKAALYSPMPIQPLDSMQEVDPDTAVFNAAFEQASGALALWDSYASVLGGSNSANSLKEAYALLEGIDSQVAQLKGNPAVSRSAALESLLNELEIMSTTEKFKFNRGDYLI